jgi:hypothetical protein
MSETGAQTTPNPNVSLAAQAPLLGSAPSHPQADEEAKDAGASHVVVSTEVESEAPNVSGSMTPSPQSNDVTIVENHQNSETIMARTKSDMKGEEKLDPAFWRMPLGSRIVVFDLLHSSEHIAERIHAEGGEAWLLFDESMSSSSLLLDTDLSKSLIIRGSEGNFRFVKAEEKPQVNNASSSVDKLEQSGIPANSLRGTGKTFLQHMWENNSPQICNGASRQEFQGGGGKEEYAKLVSPAHKDRNSCFERTFSHKMGTPNSACATVSMPNSVNKSAKFDESSHRAYVRLEDVSLSNLPDVHSITFVTYTAFMDEKVLKEQGPSMDIRGADSCEGNTCRYLVNAQKAAVMGTAAVVQINGENSGPGENEAIFPSSLWAFGCILETGESTLEQDGATLKVQPFFVPIKSIMTVIT